MPPAKKPPSKELVKKETKPPVGRASMFKTLAAELSLLGGKTDKDGAIIRHSAPVLLAGDDDGNPSIKLPGVISTRCATLDWAIGRGGIPMARISTITGGEAGGKTTIALHTAAECQAMGGVVIYVDNEHKLDLDYAKALGVNLKEMLLTQPGTIEDGLSIINETVIRVHKIDPNVPVLAILDSINASKSINEYEEDGTANFEKGNQAGLGAQARILSDRLPKMARMLNNRKAALFMISQPRDNIGGYGGQNLIAGGNAPKFYSSVIIQLIRKGFSKESEKAVGSDMIAKVIKNQVAAPFKEAAFMVRWGSGIDSGRALIEQAASQLIIQRGANAWFEMEDPINPGGKPIRWQAARGFQKLITDRPEVHKWLIDEVRRPFNETGEVVV